jgi:hypothetical protein
LEEQAVKDKAKICDLQQLSDGKEQKIGELSRVLEMQREEATFNLSRAK